MSCAPSTYRLHLLLYQYCEGADERRKPFRINHLAHARAAQERGELILGGALAGPVDGAVLVFNAMAENVEHFARADPYWLNGIVESYAVREWSVVAGSIMPDLPPPPAFVPSYEWANVPDGSDVPPGLEIQMSLEGGPTRARIPPRWQLAVGMSGELGIWRCKDIKRTTTVGELRQSAAEHAGVPLMHVGLHIGGIELTDDQKTVEQISLFTRSNALAVKLRVSN
eukprot:CAMPEP_0119318658 /NCGR_PEP_ID=MMETSP1333-20130426/47078_1 /TAXON_ID=418940 /ORGANISM="Scyphosphaera apsteinii, Strain RCC1455" /LENGTH=225 /DNA_ID=CAMNT_0007324887 /DNA_START=129 /DNA_END=806 /DNA_ORIENTATION=+